MALFCHTPATLIEQMKGDLQYLLDVRKRISKFPRSVIEIYAVFQAPFYLQDAHLVKRFEQYDQNISE